MAILALALQSLGLYLHLGLERALPSTRDSKVQVFLANPIAQRPKDAAHRHPYYDSIKQQAEKLANTIREEGPHPDSGRWEKKYFRPANKSARLQRSQDSSSSSPQSMSPFRPVTQPTRFSDWHKNSELRPLLDSLSS